MLQSLKLLLLIALLSALINCERKKILIKGVPSSSHVRINSGIAQSLRSKGHDVTIIFRTKDPIVDELKRQGIRVLFEPPLSREVQMKHYKIVQEYKQNGTLVNIWDNVGTHLDAIFNHQMAFYKYLYDQKFDMIISEQMQYQQVLANYLEIPIFIQVMNGPGEAEFYQKSGEYVAHSSQENLMRQVLFDQQPKSQFYLRVQNFMTLLAHRSLFEHYLKQKIKEILPIEYHSDALNRRVQNLSLILNIEGINPPIPSQPTIKYIFPKYKQGVSVKDQVFNDQLQEFLYFNKKVCLVAFGTQYKPNNKQLESIMGFMKNMSLNSDWAFVYAKRDLNESIDMEIVRQFQLKYPKILIQKFVPQIKLLEHPHLKAFLSHGGSNSMLESIEAMVPIIIAPISVYDQFLHCNYVEKRRLGQCVANISQDRLENALIEIEHHQYYQQQLPKYSEVIKQKREDDPEDLEYWIDYIFEIGSNQFRQEQYHRELAHFYMDLDFAILILINIFSCLVLSQMEIPEPRLIDPLRNKGKARSQQHGKEQQQKKKKILLKGVTSTSHIKVNTGIAVSLAEKGYDVTMILAKEDDGVKKMREKGVKVIYEPPLPQESVANNKIRFKEAKDNQGVLKVWDTSAVNLHRLFNEQFDFYKNLKSQKFDMLITEQMLYLQTLANYLEIPVFLHIMNGPIDGDILHKLAEPYFHSTHYNLQRQMIFGDMPQSTFIERVQHFTTEYIQKSWFVLLLKWTFEKELQESEVRYITQTRIQNMTISINVDGVNPPIYKNPSVRFVQNKYKQQLTGSDFMMNEELSLFYQQNNKIVLVAFGTQFQPSEYKMGQLYEFMKVASARHGWSFVVVNKKDNMQSEENINFKKRFPKILKQNFVPQVTMLSHPHTKVFISHGGSNSVQESLEAQVPMIILPISIFDQFMFCYHVKRSGYGRCLRNHNWKYYLEELLTIERSGFYKENLRQISNAIKESKNDPEDMEYWVDYIFDVGVEQFRPFQYQSINFLAFMQTDIFLVFYLIFLGIAYLIFRSILRVIKLFVVKYQLEKYVFSLLLKFKLISLKFYKQKTESLTVVSPKGDDNQDQNDKTQANKEHRADNKGQKSSNKTKHQTK
ncbi:antennal-enriched udp-glycosyltransferase [Stylonychia lemnae]|uniref:Antennal-enriched udp-glycosyltransferase n=1 Tax=Stylonychia lemnae TaxID=5949 RepID=A0A078AFS2_STYLE|nr:antennal-enriched udp-glycosyltransferase [Stylonychia lemnae]|eukprot:CDW80342.1 antennal-enriched udp-glycosyltransferase [Stylonychia lemnae]